MKILSWNVRGLGGFEKKREVRHSMSRLDKFLLSDT